MAIEGLKILFDSVRFELKVVEDQRRVLGVTGGIEDFEHGEGVVAGGDFLDPASGEGSGGAIDKYGGAICCPRKVIEALICWPAS